MDFSFHENLRQGYLKIAAENPKRYRVIDAAQSPEKVHEEIMKIIREIQ